jgi:hypothetical protein
VEGRGDVLDREPKRDGQRRLGDAGVPQAVIMELGTWKTTAAFGRYRITRDEAKRQAVEQMERHMAAERQRTTVVPIREAV